jgi:hypothetical protein
MLDPIISTSAPDNTLMTLWVSRYLPDLSSIPFYIRKLVANKLSAAIEVQNRQKMADGILTNLATDCTFAGIEAQKLCLKAGEGLKITEAKELGNHIATIYRKLLELYVEDFVFAPVIDFLYELDTQEGRISAASRILPAFNRLSQEIEPLLKQLQDIYVASDNRRAIGFLTTQLHLTRNNILMRLDSYGKMWLSSYLKLIEEQVCMPWGRICRAATNPGVNSMALKVVEQMFPVSQTIADKVYQRAVLDFPHHVSRQGRIQTVGVQTSSTRDLNMFQAYIWLCLLEGNVSVIREELLPLCLLVFPALDVKWSFVEQGVIWIVEEIQLSLDGQQNQLFGPFGEEIRSLFAKANPDFVDEDLLGQKMRVKAAMMRG